MKLNEFRTGKIIEVKNPKELKELLKYCNPSMMKHYKQQLPSDIIVTEFGAAIKIKRANEQ
jgi:hypothetical protein